MKKMKSVDWNAEGEKRFGKNRMNWKFQCPSCKGVQTALDLISLKRAGVPPATVLMACKDNFRVTKGKLVAEKFCKFNVVEFVHDDLVIVLDKKGTHTPVLPFAE